MTDTQTQQPPDTTEITWAIKLSPRNRIIENYLDIYRTTREPTKSEWEEIDRSVETFWDHLEEILKEVFGVTATLVMTYNKYGREYDKYELSGDCLATPAQIKKLIESGIYISCINNVMIPGADLPHEMTRFRHMLSPYVSIQHVSFSKLPPDPATT